MSEISSFSPEKLSPRIQFLALLDTLEPLIKQGHSLRSLYTFYQSSLCMSYPHFTRYVKLYLPYARKSKSLSGASSSPSKKPFYHNPKSHERTDLL